MINIKLPQPLKDNTRKSCGFLNDNLFVASSYWHGANTLVYQADTTRAKLFANVTDCNASCVLKEQNDRLFLLQHPAHTPQYKKEIKEDKITRCRINFKNPDLHNHGFARKNNYFVAIKKCAEGGFDTLPVLKNLINKNLFQTIKKLTTKQFCIYNSLTDTTKVFLLSENTVCCAIGNSIAAAVTDQQTYFFDLD